jgi:hypothetical protein
MLTMDTWQILQSKFPNISILLIVANRLLNMKSKLTEYIFKTK